MFCLGHGSDGSVLQHTQWVHYNTEYEPAGESRAGVTLSWIKYPYE